MAGVPQVFKSGAPGGRTILVVGLGALAVWLLWPRGCECKEPKNLTASRESGKPSSRLVTAANRYGGASGTANANVGTRCADSC